MKVGTVIRWENYPSPQYDSKIKARWFIYIGRTSIAQDPVIFYLPTTTTNQINLGTNYIEFKKETYPIFDDDCYVNLDERPHHVEEQKTLGNPDIEIKKDILDSGTMKRIYQCILNSDKYSPIDKCNIYNSFCGDGIDDIMKPPKLSGRK